MLDGQVTVKIADLVAEITLDRPQKHNAMTPAMANELTRVCAELDKNDAVRVIVLKGTGERAFSAGSDLQALAQYESAWAFRSRVEYATAVRNLGKPVIAVLKGWVLGGGLELALASDIRLAGRSAKFGTPEVKHGWIPGAGGTQMLPRLVGYGRALHMLLSGDTIDAETALQLGIVEEVMDDAALADRAAALAKQIAGYKPVAVQAIKASVRMALSASLDDGIRYENEMNTLCFSGSDHLEGIKKFYEKQDEKPKNAK
jgi:enoyl-CoA hydratase